MSKRFHAPMRSGSWWRLLPEALTNTAFPSISVWCPCFNGLYSPFQREWSTPGLCYTEQDHTNQKELALASTGHPTPCKPTFWKLLCLLLLGMIIKLYYDRAHHIEWNQKVFTATRLLTTWWPGDSWPSRRLNASRQSTLATSLDTRKNVRKSPALLEANTCAICNGNSGQFSPAQILHFRCWECQDA